MIETEITISDYVNIEGKNYYICFKYDGEEQKLIKFVDGVEQ